MLLLSLLCRWKTGPDRCSHLPRVTGIYREGFPRALALHPCGVPPPAPGEGLKQTVLGSNPCCTVTSCVTQGGCLTLSGLCSLSS